MVLRFCLYSVLKNLRFFENFFIIYLLAPSSLGGAGLTFLTVGTLTGYQRLVTALLETPSGFLADHWGRRKSLVVCFASYTVAFPLYALSSQISPQLQLALLFLAQTLFGIGEAFRTGTHKAIMLDWVDRTTPPGGATRLVGFTRFWSKITSGVSALLGGILLWRLASFTWLFWLATLPAALGIVLILSYPRELEGEMVRDRSRTPGGDRSRPSPGWRDHLRNLWAVPGATLLFVQSVLFESQIKLAQQYLQPFLEFGLATKSVAVVGGVGAVFIGLYYLVQDGLGGVSSWMSGRLEQRLGSGVRSLRLIHGAAALIVFMVSASLLENLWIAGVVGFLVLAVLQNMRRPIFISAFNEVMDKPQRAATLSLESQSRSVVFALLAPLTGWAADTYGLAAALALLIIPLALAAALSRRG